MATANVNYFGKTDLLYLVQLINTELNKYIKAVEGKGLSERDFTQELLTKLNGIEEGAQVNNPVDAALNADSENAVQNKAVKGALDLKAPLASPALTGIPTAPTATEGDNSTAIATTAYVLRAINAAIGEVVGLKIEKYNSILDLPEMGSVGVIYLVPNGGAGKNVHDEYFWDGENYELFGTTAVDLSGYLKSEDVEELTEAEVKAVWDSVFTE